MTMVRATNGYTTLSGKRERATIHRTVPIPYDVRPIAIGQLRKSFQWLALLAPTLNRSCPAVANMAATQSRNTQRGLGPRMAHTRQPAPGAGQRVCAPMRKHSERATA